MTKEIGIYRGIQIVMLSLSCLSVIVASGLFIVGQGGGPYHLAPILRPAPISEQTLPAAPPGVTALADDPQKVTAASLLYRLNADPDVDMIRLVDLAIGAFDDRPVGGVLESYLLWAIRTEKSDAYIDSLLNSAAAKGDFHIPLALTTVSGRLDTQSLLKSVLVAATQPELVTAASTTQHHLLRLSDSLAGLSLTYYGDPRDHARIANANRMIDRMASAQVGQVVEIPGL